MIGHVDHDVTVEQRGGDVDGSPLRRVLDCVVDQVRERLAQSSTVASNRRQSLGDARDNRYLSLRGSRRRNRLPHERGHVDVRECVGERPGFDARGVEHVAYQTREAVRLIDDQREQRVALIG